MPAETESQRKAKRRKLVGESSIPEIESIDDLRRLLNFQPDFQLEVKAAIQRFKQFLTSITGLDDDAARIRSLEILRGYSKDKILPNQEDAPFSSLISLWSSAVDTNDESILSSVPSVLALFLKTISSFLEFRILGLSLCNSLLLKDKLRLFARGLTATKTKEHLISPCLRLLTEIVNFDGGELASVVYSKREITFKRLEVFLDQRNPSTPSEDVQQKPTLRRTAQRFLLANLKFQSASAKGDIITQGRTIRACLQNMKNDRPDIVTDILVSLEKDVVRASALTKVTKGRLFDNSNLSLLSSLYKFHEPASDPPSDGSVRAQVDILLRLICTQPESGILLPQNGWYPAGSNPEKSLKASADPNTIESNADSSFNSGHRDKSVPKNGVLSTFIQALRPDVDTLQASLLLDIFRAAPELVADYFARKSNFIAEPKDTPAWLGQSAFLFSAIQLPVPKYCGWRDGYAASPPPSSTVIESILPRPLDRTNTTRALNLNHEVITLFAVRAVTVAFQKLSKVLELYGTPTSNLDSWKQASSDLISAFSQRCPSARDVLSTLQRTPKSDEKLRGSIIELLSKYYQVLPHLMLLEKLDASSALVDTISRVEKGGEEQSLKAMRFSELENLLKIAQISPETKWWHKPDSLHYSTFTLMLKAVLEADQSTPAISSIRQLLRIIAVEHGLLPDNLDYFDVLMTSLLPGEKWLPGEKTVSFFDNCASRIARQPAHYEDLAAKMKGDRPAMCLLPFCISEQWPFVIAAEEAEDRENIASWISRLFMLLTSAGEDEDVIQALRNEVVTATSEATLCNILRKGGRKVLKKIDTKEQIQDVRQVAARPKSPSPASAPHDLVALGTTFERQPKRVESMEGLERLHQEELGEVIANGRLGRLCRSLSSLQDETRRQAFITLQSILRQIELSHYSEKGPVFVLIGELVETVKSIGLANPLASIITEFAAAAIEILDQPAHAVYGKINKFLQKSPSWDLAKFISYWTEKILLREPEDNMKGLFQEMTWLLNLLLQGLRDNEDMELYRKSDIFERLLTLYSSVLCTSAHRRQILELIYRVINLGSGMTLITRTGIESWFAMRQADDMDGELIKAIEDQMHDRIDKTAAQKWRIPSATTLKAL